MVYTAAHIRKPAYDQRCEDLAWHFLEGEKGLRDGQMAELAALIQCTIEDWIAANLPDDYDAAKEHGFGKSQYGLR